MMLLEEVKLMPVVGRAAVVAVLVALATAPAVALDCERVKALHAEGTRASDIARELGITTPEVQACLADALESAERPRGQIGRGPLVPQLPGQDGTLPRQPNQ
jgi:hypothetical protein